MSVRTRVAAILAAGLLAGTALIAEAPAVAPAAVPVTLAANTSAARPGLSSYTLVRATPLFDKKLGKPAMPLIGQYWLVLKNNTQLCIDGEGAGNPVKTSNGPCSTFNTGYPPPDNCGPGAFLMITPNGLALRAENSSQIVELTGEANPGNDTNAVWDGPNPTPTNCKFGALSNLVAANNAPNSSVYARNHAGDWRFITSGT